MEEHADLMRDTGLDEQEVLQVRLRRLESKLRGMQTARAEIVARTRDRGNRMRDERNST